MPELPEVETVVRALDSALTGRKITGIELHGRMRRPFGAKNAAERLAGRVIKGARRRAKYIVIDLDAAGALLAHLGMTGYFHIDAADIPRHVHDRLAIALEGGDELRYADARRFGFVMPATLDDSGAWPGELARLGMEPLDRGFSAGFMADKARGRKTPVKVFMMIQEIVVGIGNIYASEALFAAGIDPGRPAGTLKPDEWERVVREVRSVLRRAIRKDGSSIRNYRTVDGGEGGFQRALRVYGRAGLPCSSCGTAVASIRQGGRSTFFCPECQR